MDATFAGGQDYLGGIFGRAKDSHDVDPLGLSFGIGLNGLSSSPYGDVFQDGLGEQLLAAARVAGQHDVHMSSCDDEAGDRDDFVDTN